MPKRYQLSRRKGWRKPEGAVVVSRPSKWANRHDWRVLGRAEAAVRYAEDAYRDPEKIAAIRAELRGKDVCCWCPLDDFCHGDVLLEIANRGDS
ncbi:MAG: DUF4326 domain-containing protein [Chloroflexota bacterium]|nr:DUF4326 domain-containing protein [Chloroflexota bacterium]